MDTTLTSCLYDCEVVHQRLLPKRHAFRYRLFFLDVDLDELPALSKRVRLLSHNRFNVYSLFDKDHLDVDDNGLGLRANLKIWMKERDVDLADDDRVRLLTLPRVMGYIFNPVCFYFISDREGNPRCVVVEVRNTFRELKPWLISDHRERDGSPQFHLRTRKNFYVSPYTSLEAEFEFRVKIPGERLEIHIDDIEDGKTTLLSWIRGERRALTDARLLWYCFRFPLLTVGVIFRIHWQALKLWLKRIPFYRKAANPELQTDLHHPHCSLTRPPPSDE